MAPAALAGTILVLAGVHLVLDDDRLAIELAEVSILLVFAAALAFVTVRVHREDHGRDRTGRIVSASLGAGIGVGLLSSLYLLARLASREPVSEGWFVVSIGWSLGASAGALVGYYVERVRRERAEQSRLTGRLTVLNRVLRHNIRNEVGVIGGLAENAIQSTDDPELAGDLALLRSHVEAAIREALDNVVQHNETQTLSVEVTVAREDGWTTVELVDDGSSIPEEELAALSASRELPLQHVTGLGLWVVHWVVELSDGRLDIENLDPSGVRVSMRFRSAESASGAS